MTTLHKWIQTIIKFATPLVGYAPLERSFFLESESLFRTVLKWAGFYLCLINLTLIAVDYATIEPSMFYPLFVSHVIEFCFGIFLIIWSYKIKNLFQVYRYVRIGMVLDTLNICIATFLIQDVLMTSLFLIATVIAMLIFPWPIQYTIGVELAVIVYSFIFFPRLSYENTTTSAEFMIALCVSAAVVITIIHAVLTSQRWQNFLRRNQKTQP